MWGVQTKFSEHGLTYDVNGNILTLTRTAEQASGNQSVKYFYEHTSRGNLLTGVTVNNGSKLLFSYDAVGNMTDDGLSGTKIVYNLLDLPEKIHAAGNATNNIRYIYSAGGEKLASVVGSSVTYYRSVFTYSKSGTGAEQLQYVLHPEGLVAKTNNTWEYRYFKRDHVGSTRVVLAARSGRLDAVQSTDYYPFGMAHGSLNELHLNRYLYGGKEYQDAVIGGQMLGLYDFHARYYNPMLGRWFNQDPRLQTTNPYLYCGNSPMMYVDPDGEFFFLVANFVKDLFVNTFVKSWTEGINAWTDKKNWHSTTMSARLYAGLGKGSFGEILSRFTWQLPQTFIGHVTNQGQNLFGGVKSVSYYRGATAVETYSRDWGAFTLGSFILGQRGLTADPSNSLFQHEFGHYLQSRAAGPLYLAKYGIPSLYDAMKDKNYTHYAHPTEQDANARALMYFEKKYPGFAEANSKREEGAYGWNHRSNPIIGYQLGRTGGYRNADNQAALKRARIKAYDSPWDVMTGIFSYGLVPVQTLIFALPYEDYYVVDKAKNLER